MNDNGWIKIHRQIKDWQHYQEPSVLLVWIDLLLSANTEPCWYHGKRIEKGEVVTSVAKISETTKLSHMTVKNALKKLEESGEIKKESNNKYTKITIKQYDKYQCKLNISEQGSQQNISQQNISQQGSHQGEEEKKGIKKEEEREEPKNTPPVVPPTGTRRGVEFFGTFHNVELLPVELRTLQMNYGEQDTAAAIDDLSCKLMDGTQQSNAHYATLTHWLSHRKKAAPRTNGYKGDATIGSEFVYKP